MAAGWDDGRAASLGRIVDYVPDDNAYGFLIDTRFTAVFPGEVLDVAGEVADRDPDAPWMSWAEKWGGVESGRWA